MKTYNLYWSPTGQKIATVQAKTSKAAKRKAPAPYRKYLGEIYTELVAGNPGGLLSSASGWIKAKAVRIRKVGGRKVVDILTTRATGRKRR